MWFNGIVVVASAGNKLLDGFYNTTKAAPTHDPFLIVVSAMDEMNMSRIRDNVPGAYSAYDITGEGFARPDLMESGSGTSMASPMVTGAIALFLQDEPNLTPSQVKYRLLNTSSLLIDPGNGISVPYLNVYNAVTGKTPQAANTGYLLANCCGVVASRLPGIVLVGIQ